MLKISEAIKTAEEYSKLTGQLTTGEKHGNSKLKEIKISRKTCINSLLCVS